MGRPMTLARRTMTAVGLLKSAQKQISDEVQAVPKQAELGRLRACDWLSRSLFHCAWNFWFNLGFHHYQSQ
jgi:hypothetical protein